MTLIAAQMDKTGIVWMAADSLGSNSNGDRYIRKDKKIFKKDGYLIGYTSSYRMGQIIEHKAKLPELPLNNRGNIHIVKVIDAIAESLYNNNYTMEKDNRHYGGEFIIGWHGRLYCIQSDFQYSTTAINYMCCGAGEDFGLGALHTAQKLKGSNEIEALLYAMRAGTKHNCFVAPPFIVMNTKGYRKIYKK